MSPGSEFSGRVFVVLPAYDEAERLPPLLDELRTVVPDAVVIVIDDGSGDGTGATARDHGAVVLRHPFNLGYGAALQTGYKYALEQGAQALVQMDADGQHRPESLQALLAPVLEGACDLCVGSRFLEETGYRMSPLHALGRRALSAVARLARLRSTDPTSGLQAMNRRALELFATDLYPSDYPDVDVLLLAQRSGLRIEERPVRMNEGLRRSRLHSGTAGFYYAYRMLLALWATSSVRRVRRASPASESEPTATVEPSETAASGTSTRYSRPPTRTR